MPRIKYLARKTIETLRGEGLNSLTRKTRNYIHNAIHEKSDIPVKDILVINGCGLPHPERYRVDHLMEQLEANGLSADKVFYDNISLDRIKFYRGFVFFRCPTTKKVESFIKKAHYFNKTCFFDIDDLVINRKYTDSIPYVASMPAKEKKEYDKGIVDMEKTLKDCDYLITSTPVLANELRKNYKKEVFINKNVASERMVELSANALKTKRNDKKKIIIGYLSGSITHNPDFELIKEPLLKIMKEYPQVYIEIMGFLDIPSGFEKYKDRIICKQFTDWKNLPKIISELTINLAPIEKTIFNEAKSENKWTEASLVKTITVASNFGAFKEVIDDAKTGFLADNEDEWYEKIKYIIDNPQQAERIATSAYKKAMKDYVTTYSGLPICRYIENHLAKNIAFVLPTTNISGGVNVVIKHCNILRKKGLDVTIINMDKPSDNIKTKDGEINVFSGVVSASDACFDSLVATLWTTLDYVKRYPNVKNRFYLVQNFETNFADFGSYSRIKANATYSSFSPIKYVTISKWCKKWLEKDYFQTVRFAPNGIDIDNYAWKKRSFKGRIKILIEGNSRDYYKNVDESFRIVEKLDSDKFEIQYLSYEGEPKKWYRVDKFFHKIPADEVHKIYEGADILIKSSLLESFSYPPLEMMATGGICVVAPNDGNIEYLKNEENCLFYEPGNINSALEKIDRIVNDEKLRETIINNSKKTVKERDWKKIEPQITELYK